MSGRSGVKDVVDWGWNGGGENMLPECKITNGQKGSWRSRADNQSEIYQSKTDFSETYF